MDVSLRDELVKVPDLRHQVRRLRWFRDSFRRIACEIGDEHGLAVEVQTERLTEAFLNWVEKLGRQKTYADFDRRSFSCFAAGLLLQELLSAKPLKLRPAESAPSALPGDARRAIVDFWAEGFLYTSYCLCVLNAVYEQEFHQPLTVSPAARDLHTWWSFRENAGEDPALAIGFLDQFLGNEPNWTTPDSASVRPDIRRQMESARAAGAGLPESAETRRPTPVLAPSTPLK